MKNISDLICEYCRDRHGRLNLENLKREAPAMNSILDALSEGIIVADKEGRFVYFNPVAETILGMGMTDTKPLEWPSVYWIYYPDESTPYLA